MFLSLTDGVETVFLAVILKAIHEGKTLSEILDGYVARENVPRFIVQIQGFSEAKLEHPILKLALEELEELLSTFVEKKMRYERNDKA